MEYILFFSALTAQPFGPVETQCMYYHQEESNMSLKVGDLVSYQDFSAKWIGVVKRLIPGTDKRAVVCWIDPYSGKLDTSSVNSRDTRFRIEAEFNVQSR